MRAPWFRALGYGVLVLSLVPVVRAAEKEQPPAKPAKTDKPLDPQALAARIDAHIQARWATVKVTPARRADDAEFLRRVSLDIIGRIPTVSEIHDFLSDPSPDRRTKLVARLLDSYGYVNHFTAVWRELLIPQSAGNNQLAQAFGPQMESWLSKKLRDNAPYDSLVRDLLTADPLGARTVRRGQPIDPTERTVIAFYQANENKPENLAATVSRLFLGVKLECAQCHDHPFNHYSRAQFGQTAAVFARLTPQRIDGQRFTPAGFDPKRAEIKIPNTEKVVKARFLDGTLPKFAEDSDSRVVLADWITAPDNPYFGRAAVNYVWAHFFGLGIIDPVDEPSEQNPPSHPELLDEMARQFVLNKCDLKYLIKAITASQAYQLSSAVSHPTQADPRAFAVMQLKGLSPEQLLES